CRTTARARCIRSGSGAATDVFLHWRCTMQVRLYALMMACAMLPAALAAQGTTAMAAPAASTSPVADALRQMEQRSARNLIAAAEAMPTEKYGYRPTPAQIGRASCRERVES